jgi:integrase
MDQPGRSGRTGKNGPHEDRGWNIYRRKGGQHVLQFRTGPRGSEWRETRIPREHHTEKQAERYALAWLAEYRKMAGTQAGLAEPDEVKSPTIRSLADAWVDLCDKNPKLSPAMRKQHASSMRVHVLPYPEVSDVPIASLGPAVLRGWLRKVRDNGKVTIEWKKGEDGKRTRGFVRGGKLAPFSCRNVVNSLTAFFADMLAEEKIRLPANPMRHEAVRREVPEAVTLAGKHIVVHMSREAAERLIVCPAVPEWRRVRHLLAFTSGMAEGELSGITFEDVLLDAEVPLVKVTKALALEGPDGWATLGPTKTDNRVRTLPLHHLAVRALRAWKATGWARWVGHKPESTDIVFPNEDGKGWRPDMAVMIRADLRKTGLPDSYEGHKLTAHATRRSFSTWLSEAGVEEATRDRLMGHAPATVAERHYTSTILTKLRDAVESIKLELTMGQIIALPMRAVASGETASEPGSEAASEPAQAAGLTAVLTAARGKGDAIADDSSAISGTPGRTRTCDPRLRRPLLYPAELRALARVLIAVLGSASAVETLASPRHYFPLSTL